MRPRSKKQEAAYRLRRPLVAELLEAEPICQAGGTLRLTPGRPRCTGRAVDVHELLSRGRGGSILERENCITVCRECHTFITENPGAAESLGLALSKGGS